MTQKYKKEEKANKYIYRVPYQKNETLDMSAGYEISVHLCACLSVCLSRV